MPHKHKCTRCMEPFECGGEQWFNYDGWPEVVCRSYHEHQEDECEKCVTTDWCDECGEQAVAAYHDGDDICEKCYFQRTAP